MSLGNEATWQYFRVMYERYHQADDKHAEGYLDELCLTPGYNRKYAIRMLNRPRPEKERVRLRRRRKMQDCKQVIAILGAVWEAPAIPGRCG